MEGSKLLPPTVNLPSLIDLRDYVKSVGSGLQIPWCLEQDFAQSESGGPKNALQVCRGGLSEFCPENGGDRYSMDVLIKSMLQVKRLSSAHGVSAPVILLVPLKFVETVFELKELTDYSKDSWNVFQDFLLKQWPQDERKTMLEILPAFPLHDGSLVLCTGTDDRHIIMNSVKKSINETTGGFVMKIDIYDSNHYGITGGQEGWDRRELVLSYIALFSYIKAVAIQSGKKVGDYKYIGSSWPQDRTSIAFKGCLLGDRMTTCQLGESCYLHASYNLLKYIMRPSYLTPPLNEMEQLLYGGLVNLHLLRTGKICTNYSQFLFQEKETMLEWRKCLHAGIYQKLKIVTQDASYFSRVVKSINDTCETLCPPQNLDTQPEQLQEFYSQNVAPICTNPKSSNATCFHFWISLFTSKTMMHLNKLPAEPKFPMMEPSKEIKWKDAKVYDPIQWNQILVFPQDDISNSNDTSEARTTLKRLAVFPIMKNNFLAIAAFYLSYLQDGSGLKKTLLVIDSDSAFTTEERTTLIKYIFEEKIKKSMQFCKYLELQDISVQCVSYSRPLVWQEECCGFIDSAPDNKKEPCWLWKSASNLSVLYAYSRFPYTNYARFRPHYDDNTRGKLYDCDCFDRLSALENQVAVITEVAPFSFALAFREYFED